MIATTKRRGSIQISPRTVPFAVSPCAADFGGANRVVERVTLACARVLPGAAARRRASRAIDWAAPPAFDDCAAGVRGAGARGADTSVLVHSAQRSTASVSTRPASPRTEARHLICRTSEAADRGGAVCRASAATLPGGGQHAAGASRTRLPSRVARLSRSRAKRDAEPARRVPVGSRLRTPSATTRVARRRDELKGPARLARRHELKGPARVAPRRDGTNAATRVARRHDELKRPARRARRQVQSI